MTSVPPGLLLGQALFSIFVGDVDRGIKCALRKSVNYTELCGTANTPEGRSDIERDLDRLEKWTYVILMKFNKVKCRILQLGQGNTKHKHSLGNGWVKSRPEKVLGVLVD